MSCEGGPDRMSVQRWLGRHQPLDHHVTSLLHLSTVSFSDKLDWEQVKNLGVKFLPLRSLLFEDVVHRTIDAKELGL